MMVLMEQLLISIVLGVFGLVLGSFAGATGWRLRALQLVQDKKDGEDVDAKEYKTLLPLTKSTLEDDRSRCLSCGHQLGLRDLIPLVSWLSTKGNCRYCKKPIGRFEPMIELGVAALFVISYLVWPIELVSVIEILQFGLWLVAGVMLAILFAYDLKWYLLPDVVVFPLIVVAFFIEVLRLIGSTNLVGDLISLVIAIVILSGIYFAIWLGSKGRWIGFGDVKLGLALALLVGFWPLAFIALFGANLIGCIVVIPGMLAGKLSRTSRVPFGPLLIVGGVIAVLFGQAIVSTYAQAFLLL